MERLRVLNLSGIVLLIIIVQPIHASLFFNVDVDLRYKDNKFKIEALGLSGRKIFADKHGDRIILFALIDSMHNFQETTLEQAYIQYKGPMGRWNIILGRYLLPFGLLPNYSTKRLLIESLEYETIGIYSDQGLQISGVIKEFDYAIFLSQGIGSKRWTDVDNNWLVTSRVGYQGIDFEDLRVGLSILLGSVLPGKHNMEGVSKYKQLLALDLIKYRGPIVARIELTIGKEDDKRLNGIFAGFDYALFPRADLNIGYIHLNKGGGKKDVLTLGLTYNLAGFQIRAAQSLGGKQNEFSFQVYKIFTWAI